MFDLEGKRIWVAGHRGLVGGALMRRLAAEGCEILTVARDALDLREQSRVRDWVAEARPDGVILAAARVGGILANQSRPVEFLQDNLMIAVNVIEAAFAAGVLRLLFLGSSAAYPVLADQPITESSLLTGAFDPSHQWYGTAKVAGIKLCQAYRAQHGVDYIAGMPTNLYGPGDHFDPASGHVVPALIRRAHEARVQGAPELVIWGTGQARREFLHVDDCADACVHVLRTYSSDMPINIGSGEDVTIGELAAMVCEVVGYEGKLVFDASRPEGAARKLMSAERIRALGWRPRVDLKTGLAETYDWFRAHVA